MEAPETEESTKDKISNIEQSDTSPREDKSSPNGVSKSPSEASPTKKAAKRPAVPPKIPKNNGTAVAAPSTPEEPVTPEPKESPPPRAVSMPPQKQPPPLPAAEPPQSPPATTPEPDIKVEVEPTTPKPDESNHAPVAPAEPAPTAATAKGFQPPVAGSTDLNRMRASTTTTAPVGLGRPMPPTGPSQTLQPPTGPSPLKRPPSGTIGASGTRPLPNPGAPGAHGPGAPKQGFAPGPGPAKGGPLQHPVKGPGGAPTQGRPLPGPGGSRPPSMSVSAVPSPAHSGDGPAPGHTKQPFGGPAGAAGVKRPMAKMGAPLAGPNAYPYVHHFQFNSSKT